MMSQQRPKQRQTHVGCPSKSFARTRVRIKFLYSEPRASLFHPEGHLLFTPPKLLSSLGRRPTSRGPGRLLHTAARLIFQMQWWAKPISPQQGSGCGQKHFHMDTVKRHNNIGDINVTQPGLHSSMKLYIHLIYRLKHRSNDLKRTNSSHTGPDGD